MTRDAVGEARARLVDIAQAAGMRYMGEVARFDEAVSDLLSARDAAWREAVARVRARREQDIADWATGAVLDEVLRAMEGQ